MEPTTAFLIGVLSTNLATEWGLLAETLPCPPEQRVFETPSSINTVMGTLPDGSVFLIKEVFQDLPVFKLRLYCPEGTYTPPPVVDLSISYDVPTEREDTSSLYNDVPSYNLSINIDIDNITIGLEACDTNFVCSSPTYVTIPRE